MAEQLNGKYRAKPVEWALGLSKNGKEQAEVVFELLDEPHKGQRRTWTGSFASDKATEITVKALRACGLEGIDISLIDHMPPTAEEVILVIEPEEYQGKTYEKIRWVNAPRGLRTTPMDEGSKTAFAERMRGVLAGIDANQAAKGGDASDDLPF